MMMNVSMNSNRLDNDKRLDDEERGNTFGTSRSSRIVSMMTNVSNVGNAALSSYSGLELSMDSNVVMTMNTDVSTRQRRGSTLGMSRQGRGSTFGMS